MKKAIFIQGIYYLMTGLWPLLHLQSFLWVTGPKQDVWLVKLVGLLAITIGANLLARQSVLLACMTALSFAAIDTFYAFNGTISQAYLIDATIQLIFIGWILLATRIRITTLPDHTVSQKQNSIKQ